VVRHASAYNCKNHVGKCFAQQSPASWTTRAQIALCWVLTASGSAGGSQHLVCNWSCAIGIWCGYPCNNCTLGITWSCNVVCFAVFLRLTWLGMDAMITFSSHSLKILTRLRKFVSLFLSPECFVSLHWLTLPRFTTESLSKRQARWRDNCFAVEVCEACGAAYKFHPL